MLRKPARVALHCLLTMLFIYPPSVQAAEDESGPAFREYRAPGWGLTLGLGDFGTVREPGDPEWSRDDLDFLWQSDVADQTVWPLYQIDGSTVGRDETSPDGLSLSDEDFTRFFDQMLAGLAEDPQLKVIETDNNYIANDGRRWLMFHIEEIQDAGSDSAYEAVVLNYYSLFTLDESVLRLLNFYYKPISAEDDLLTTVDVMMTIDPDYGLDSTGAAADGE